VPRLDRNARVTPSEASPSLGVSIQLISMWRRNGRLRPVGKRGQSPLYRFGDLLDVERDMAEAAAHANNHRARRPIAA
jgi:predicted site-specific integrase-resolvase